MTRPGTDSAARPGCPDRTARTTPEHAPQWDALVGYREDLVRLARSRGAGADAEDVAHEALLRAATHPALDPGRARSFLAKIASNLVTDLHRRAAKEQVLSAHAALMPRPQPAMEEIEERALADHARRLVAGLDPQLRGILRRRSDGATWPQIGTELGQRKDAVEIRYRRAITPIRRQLQPG